jgi:hypothetical protein
MPTDSEQREKLFELQRIVGTYEVNTVMNQDPGDVPFVAACEVPHASQVCWATGEGYDVWRWQKGNLRPVEMGVKVGVAANVIILEYMTEKVKRAKRNDPRLRQYSDKALLTHLLKGYQSSEGIPEA